jgi:hypothetical protein
VTRAALLFVLGAVGLGCDRTMVFACETRDDCLDGPTRGTCEPDGHCSFPDAECESGRRYGEHAPTALAGTCTPVLEEEPSILVGVAESSSSSSPLDAPASRLPAGEEDTSSDGAGESSTGSHDTSSGSESSSTGADEEPQDCDALDCAGCMDCVDEPGGPCEDELTACMDANGCQSGVACMQECTLYGTCFDDCCPGIVGPLVDQLVLCTADHCIQACSEYEFLTCE